MRKFTTRANLFTLTLCNATLTLVSSALLESWEKTRMYELYKLLFLFILNLNIRKEAQRIRLSVLTYRRFDILIAVGAVRCTRYIVTVNAKITIVFVQSV